MEITLVILAAGMASRYGSMKQTEGFGPQGETIMDYSIYDAARAGFTRIVFVIRRDFADHFRSIYDARLKGKIKVDYVFQEMDAYLNGAKVSGERTKPWGTGHAILCTSEIVNEPFAVINADDFYGRDAFEKAADFLKNSCNENTYAIIGYPLVATLSDFGTVNRGVCAVNEKNELTDIKECVNISKTEAGIVYEDDGTTQSLPAESSVSMNFWCFHQSVFPFSAFLFSQFLTEKGGELKSEFFIPLIAESFIKNLGGVIQIIPTTATWFGVTYKEDGPMVRENLIRLVEKGEYPGSLWEKGFTTTES